MRKLFQNKNQLCFESCSRRLLADGGRRSSTSIWLGDDFTMLVTMAYLKPQTFSRRVFCSSSISQPPGSSEVHLWCLCPNDATQSSLLQAYEGILSLQETTHMLQLKNETVQKEYLLTRVLARTLLSRYTGGLVDPTSVQFTRSSSGKPQVVWPSNLKCESIWRPPHLSFNISHTHSLIACAVTGGYEIGVDIEEKNRELKTDLLSFARRKFSTKEYLALEGLADPQHRRHHFLQLWTLKEAYAKALGKGIGGTILRDVSFKIDVSLPVSKLLKDFGLRVHEQPYCIQFECPDKSTQLYSSTWQLLLLQLGDAHFASVCLPTTGSIEQGPEQVQQLRVQVMKMLPFVNDEPFKALVLGFSGS